jgi:macrolide-specific efflux system membrane fusion protein
MSRRRILVLIAAAGCLSACGLLPREEAPVTPVLPEPPSVSASVTYPVERVDLSEQVEGTAVVTPVRQTELYFTTSGRIAAMIVAEGEAAAAGSVLARLDSRDLQYQLSQAGVDLDIARLRLDGARITAPGNLETRIRELEVKKQELAVAHLEDLVERTIIRAPYAGVASGRRYDVGDTVGEYDTVMEILDPRELELQMKVSVDEFQLIEAGQQASVEVQREEWQPATVARAVHRVVSTDTGSRRDEYVVHLKLARQPREALGMNARLSARVIQAEHLKALAIPLAALREFNGRSYVRVLEGEVRREVDVKVGIRTSTRVEILEGLTEGVLVIGR